MSKKGAARAVVVVMARLSAIAAFVLARGAGNPATATGITRWRPSDLHICSQQGLGDLKLLPVLSLRGTAGTRLGFPGCAGP